MSLYNMLFGQNPAADMLLAILQLKREDCGRYRDCYTNEEGTEIIIHTRNGGGNREYYQSVFDALSKHPNWLGDSDDDFDCTYANIRFSVPEMFRKHVKLASDATDTTPPAEKWQRLLSDLEQGKDTAAATRALKVGEQIVGAIQAGESKTVSNPEGSVVVESFKRQI